MAAAKTQTVEMFGTGNYQIGETLYVFKDGSKVEVKNKAHVSLLEAEAQRRKANHERVTRLTAEQAAKESLK